MAEEKCIINPAMDCLGLMKANLLEKRIDEILKNSKDTHGEIFDRIVELEKAESARNQQYLNIMEKLNNLSEDIEKTMTTMTEITNKPAKKWDAMSEKIIWAIIAACIGFILSQVGIS